MVTELSNLIGDSVANQSVPIQFIKDDYKKAISTSEERDDLVMRYIKICEELRSALVLAEQEMLFLRTYALKRQWLQTQGSGDDFKPNIPELFQAMEEDLINYYQNSTTNARVRLGLIGFTSVGKSASANRLNNVSDPIEGDAAVMSRLKSTFFPSEFNRAEPLVDTSCNPHRRTFVTIVDIQGLDENRLSNQTERKVGNYFDEIAKADCDIYLLLFDKLISEQQKLWIAFIEQVLERKCILIRSKIDVDFLDAFAERYNNCYHEEDGNQRIQLSLEIIEQLRQENAVDSRDVFLVFHNYQLNTLDARMLKQEQPFDNDKLLQELARVAAEKHSSRVYLLAFRTMFQMMNTCFRRGYILNAMKYKVAAGFAAIIPFGEQFPRYLARDAIRNTFGISKEFHEYLKTFSLKVHGYKLQTSVFEETVKLETESRSYLAILGNVAGAAGNGLVVAGASVLDDIVKVVSSAVTILSITGRVIFTSVTMGIGFALTAPVCVWAAYSNGKHIFSYINRLCDDMIMISNAFIFEIIVREQTPPAVEARDITIELPSPLPIQ